MILDRLGRPRCTVGEMRKHKVNMVYPISAGGLLKGRLNLGYTFWLFCHHRLRLVGVYDLY